MTKKRLFFWVLLACTVVLQATTPEYRFLVGTYTTNTSSEGIYSIQLDKRGKMISKKLLAKSENPSFISISEDKKFVYVVNETGDKSSVSAFSFDAEKETLKLINKVEAQGNDPCYISCSEKHIFTANYSSGNISVFERLKNGGLSEAIQTIELPRMLYGRGLKGPNNAHQILLNADKKIVYVNNLGNNEILIYSYNATAEKKVLKYKGSARLPKLSGPRHSVISKDGNFLYLVCELNSSIYVFSILENGSLSELQSFPLTENLAGRGTAADIHLSPDGKHLYVTNREEYNDITHFKVRNNGELELKTSYSTNGIAPRNFAITNDKKFLLVGNQKSDNITIFKRKSCSGKLKHKPNLTINLPAPVCLIEY